MNDEKQATPTLLSEEEFFARVDEAREQIKQGKSISFSNPQEMNKWLNSLWFFLYLLFVHFLLCSLSLFY